MTIIISKAPSEYRKYLKAGDSNNGPKGKNGKIDTEKEAVKAAEAYYKDGSYSNGTAFGFLEYLQESGYPFVSQEMFSKAPFDIAKEVASRVDVFINNDHDKNFEAANSLRVIAVSDIQPKYKSMMVKPVLLSLAGNKKGSLAADVLGWLAASNIPVSDKQIMIDPLISAYKNGCTDAAWALQRLANSDIPLKDKARVVEAFVSIPVHDKNPDSPMPDSTIYAYITMCDETKMPLSFKLQVVESLTTSTLNVNDHNEQQWAVFALGMIADADLSPELDERMVAPLLKAAKEGIYFSGQSLGLLSYAHLSYASKEKMVNELISDLKGSVKGEAVRALNDMLNPDATQKYIHKKVVSNLPADLKAKVKAALK